MKLSRDLKGSRVCDFVAALAEDLGVWVYPDSRAWGAEVKLPGKTSGMTVRQLAAVLRRKDIEVVVETSPFFNRPQPWSPGQPRPTRPPPGGPEVDWSIYLLQRKK